MNTMNNSEKKALKVTAEVIAGGALAGPPGVLLVAMYEGCKAVSDTIVEHKVKMAKIQGSKNPEAIEHKK